LLSTATVKLAAEHWKVWGFSNVRSLYLGLEVVDEPFMKDSLHWRFGVHGIPSELCSEFRTIEFGSMFIGDLVRIFLKVLTTSD